MAGGKFWIKFPFRAVVDKIESKPKFNQCDEVTTLQFGIPLWHDLVAENWLEQPSMNEY